MMNSKFSQRAHNDISFKTDFKLFASTNTDFVIDHTCLAPHVGPSYVIPPPDGPDGHSPQQLSNQRYRYAQQLNLIGSKISHLFILFKACLFNLTFHKGSHSKGLKQKSTACASKKNKTFHRKVFCATFHGSTNLFEKCGLSPT